MELTWVERESVYAPFTVTCLWDYYSESVGGESADAAERESSFPLKAVASASQVFFSLLFFFFFFTLSRLLPVPTSATQLPTRVSRVHLKRNDGA